MTTRLKIRAYAIFQFISFAAIIALLITGGLIANQIVQLPGDHLLKNGAAWSENIKNVLLFSSKDLGILASVLAYVSIGLFLGSWISGWMVFRVPNRNLFDSLFLLFLCLPIISNIFALFAQVASKEITFMSAKIDKKEVIEEQTRILALNKKKELRKQREINKEKKLEEEKKLASTQTIKVAKTAPAKKQAPKKAVTKKVPTKKQAPKKAVTKKVPAKKSPTKKAASTIKIIPPKRPSAKKQIVKKPLLKK